jgi:hypothetical protein
MRPRRTARVPVLLTSAAILLAVLAIAPTVHGWWENGHFYTGRAAAEALPAQMPAFFRQSVDRLSYLNYEPDRWKNSAERAADQALYGGTSPEHYINFEKVPPNLLKLTNRFDFLAAISRREPNGSQVGLLPYRILEMFQSLRVSFRLWRAAPDAGTKAWIEQRIIDDAGILGHYVADGANPLHTTVHHNGWVSRNNPRKFTTDNTLHGRFEGKFVDGRIKIEDIRLRVGAQAKVIAQPRAAIVQFLDDSYGLVDDVYVLENLERFSETTASPKHKAFVVDRIAAGATFLRDLWWTAYSTSDQPAPPPPTQSR